MIEFLNRVFTGLVSLAVIVAVLGSIFRNPRRRDLIYLSLGLVGGVIAQAVLGGLTVLYELQPPFVMAHFLVSLVLLANALVLLRRSGEPEGQCRWRVSRPIQIADLVMLVSAAVVFVAGTVVTATGPHGGDRSARRFNFNLETVARIHGSSVIVLILIIITLAVLVSKLGASRSIKIRLLAVAVVVLLQGTIGYVQYFRGIPELLVGFHIAGATAVWAAVVWFDLGLRTHDNQEIIPRDDRLADRE
jgi:cytochrome c oxidase assembly protein subunit 15